MGAALTRFPPLTENMTRSSTSSCADSSFFPPCLAISTVKVRPPAVQDAVHHRSAYLRLVRPQSNKPVHSLASYPQMLRTTCAITAPITRNTSPFIRVFSSST